VNGKGGEEKMKGKQGKERDMRDEKKKSSKESHKVTRRRRIL